MAGSIAGKRCVIVGGTSGIGLAAAELFLQEGANLVVGGRSPLAEGDSERLSALGLSACLAGEAADAAFVEQLFEAAKDRLGGLDVVFHVAGSSGRGHGDGPLHECTDDGWNHTLRANLTSVFLSNRAAIRTFRAQGSGGVILNLASVLSLSPAPPLFDTIAYTAAKGAIISLSRLAAARYAAEGIRVNVIAPGLVDTPMSLRAMQDPAIQAFLREKQPLASGACQPTDIAQAALFLCGESARMITGAVLAVDAGWSVS